jgi:hypothetical protein
MVKNQENKVFMRCKTKLELRLLQAVQTARGGVKPGNIEFSPPPPIPEAGVELP